MPRSLAALFAGRSEQLAALVPRYAWRAACSATGPTLRTFNPAEFPVSQSTKVELSINLRTAKLLGLSFPIAVLGRADEAIE